jgi:chaperone modulatory protein CbpM
MSNTRRQSEDTVLVDEHARLGVTEFAQVCGTSTAFIEELMLEGVLQSRDSPGSDDFGATEILRVRRVLRLQHTFEAPLPSVAVMVELLDEIERLRARLRSAGLTPD